MKVENFILNRSSEMNINSIDRHRKFEKIKSPDELLLFMKENIKFGFIGKDDGKIYSPEIKGWGKGEQPKQKLQNPNEVLESGYGTCLEQTELEKCWFAKKNYEFKTFLLMFGSKISQRSPAHAMLAFKKNNKWYWFENTLGDHNGIHEFDNLSGLIEEVKKIITGNALENKATKDDLKKYKMYDYNELKHNNNPDELISQIILKSKSL